MSPSSAGTIAAMRMTAWEEERLLIFTAAELARRHRAAGLRLNHPEAVALICDAMLETARAGASYEEVEAAGRAAVGVMDVIDGVRTLLDEVRLEVLVGDGTRLIVLVDPLADSAGAADTAGTAGAKAGTARAAGAAGATADRIRPGEIVPREDVRGGASAVGRGADATATGERRTLTVRNGSTRAVRVSSHYPFDRVNPRLEFDRDAAADFRLELPAGASLRWLPGEIRTVELVRYGGRLGSGGARTADGGEAEPGSGTER